MKLLENYEAGQLAGACRHHGPASRANYRVALRHFGRFLERPATVADLTNENVRNAMVWLYSDGLRRVGTVNAFRSIMLTIWRELQQEGLIQRQPDIPALRPAPSPEWARERPESQQILPPAEPEPTRGALPLPARATKADGELLSECLASGVLRRKWLAVRANTRRNYIVTVRQFERYLGRPAVLADLTTETLAACLQWLVTDGALKASTVRKFGETVMALSRILHQKRRLAAVPQIGTLPRPEPAAAVWSSDELRLLWDACRSQPGKVGRIPARQWWLALHWLLWDTGWRVQTALQVRWDSIDLEAAMIRFPADEQHHLSPEAVTALREIRRPGNPRVLPWPHKSAQLWKRYDVVLESAGLPNDRRHKFDCLRKSAAVYRRQGVPR